MQKLKESASMTTVAIARTRRQLYVTRGREHVRSSRRARSYARTLPTMSSAGRREQRGGGYGLGRRVPLDGRVLVEIFESWRKSLARDARWSSVEKRRGARATAR